MIVVKTAAGIKPDSPEIADLRGQAIGEGVELTGVILKSIL